MRAELLNNLLSSGGETHISLILELSNPNKLESCQAIQNDYNDTISRLADGLACLCASCQWSSIELRLFQNYFKT